MKRQYINKYGSYKYTTLSELRRHENWNKFKKVNHNIHMKY